MTDQDLRPPLSRTRAAAAQPARRRAWLGWLVALLGAAALGWYARDQAWLAAPIVAPDKPVVAVPSVPAPEPAPLQPLQAAPQPALAPPAAASMPAPVELAPPPEDMLALPDLDALVVQWLGQQAMQWVVTPQLARHVVATVDNLPRAHAAPRLWPLTPAGGKMVLHTDEQGQRIAPENSVRYQALVDFVTQRAPAQWVQWYGAAYPALQHQYEQLGYPGQSFHARLLLVLEHLLQTPAVHDPLAVQLVQVQQGQVREAPLQPWLRYEYVDAQLQSLSAGQKMLLRLGPAHRAKLAAFLQALHGQLASWIPTA